jgi:hypothetical protein
MISCEPNDLAVLAKCWTAPSQIQLKAMQVVLLCRWVNGTTTVCDPNSLAREANCFLALSQLQIEQILTYLWCQLVNL